MMKKFITFAFLLLILVWSAFFAVKNNLLDSGLKQIPKIEESLTNSLIDIAKIEKQIYNPPPLKILDNGNAGASLTIDGVLKWTNEMRRENGDLNLLSENEKLDVVAQKRLDDMFQKQYFEHISPSGIGVSDVAKENGFEYITIGENIALGNFDGDEILVRAWMNSPGHRANILSGRYAEIGIAVQKGKYENKETWMAIQVFALPLSACPDINETLKQEIDLNNEKIIAMESLANELRNTLESSKPRSRNEITAYNKNVDKYNEMVSNINALIKDAKKHIAAYNAQVNVFNECASGN